MLAPPDDLDWLGEFLEPGAQIEATAPSTVSAPFHTVELGPLEAAPASPPATTRRTLFVRDGTDVVAECSRDERGDHARVDDGVIHVARDERRTTIRATNRRGARQLLLFTVRELLMAEHLRARDGVVLHAAAVTIDGTTLVICGAKGSGKTTLACRVAQRGGRIVANDRVAFGRAPGFEVRAVPTVVNVRPESAELLGLDVPWPPAAWQALRRIAELPPSGRPPWPDEAPHDGYRWTMSPAQLAVVLDRPLAGSDGTPVIVFPAIDLEGRYPPTARLEPIDVARRLRAQLLGRAGARASEVLSPLTDSEAGATEHFVEQTIDEAAHQLPAHHLRLTPGWHEIPIDELLGFVAAEQPVVSP